MKCDVAEGAENPDSEHNGRNQGERHEKLDECVSGTIHANTSTATLTNDGGHFLSLSLSLVIVAPCRQRARFIFLLPSADRRARMSDLRDEIDD